MELKPKASSTKKYYFMGASFGDNPTNKDREMIDEWSQATNQSRQEFMREAWANYQAKAE